MDDDAITRRDWRFPFRSDMALAIARGFKHSTMRAVNLGNSLVDGHPCTREVWPCLDWSDFWIDGGPSPAGNAGPYFKVRKPFDQVGAPIDTIHRVYPRVQPGDRVLVCETLVHRFIAGHVACYAADGEMVIDGGARGRAMEWRWKVDTLSGRYCPNACLRWALPVLSVTPVCSAAYLTEEQALAEGVCERLVTANPAMQSVCEQLKPKRATAREALADLWIEIHGMGSFERKTPLWLYAFGDKIDLRKGA